ncbi:MAG TPA: ABC transporter ATP-binding protein [Bacteroidales bacterium]|nr:ABC transporter ATP-binding protein [Bacteroidales bacterium]
MSAPVIQIENLSKQYRLGIVGSKTIKDDVSRFWARIRGKEDPTLKIGVTNVLSKNQSDETNQRSDYVWALKDINFTVQQGEVLGIIGKNGAGKSTLLKILSKVTAPTTGSIKVKGRIASLLEVGTGFHPELSGRENIFLNGAILGMSKTEIRSKFDEIVDFSGVENYIDTPVKRYSSGMYVRLAFAVAAHLDPEILVVDEVLAVGDSEFQKKALGKMKEVSRGQGRTVLFVSHNMKSISELCSKAVLLKNGKMDYSGSVQQVIDKYLNLTNLHSFSRDLTLTTNREGNGKIRFTKYKITNTSGEEIKQVCSGQNIRIVIDFDVNYNGVLPPSYFYLEVVNDKKIPLFHLSNYLTSGEGFKFQNKITKGQVSCIIPKLSLLPGEYYFHLYCSDFVNVYDYVFFGGYLNVVHGDFYNSGKLPFRIYGDFLTENEWSLDITE